MNIQHRDFVPANTFVPEGPTARVEINADLRIGSMVVHPDFTAFVTVYRDPISERWEIDRMEIECWDKNRRTTRTVMRCLKSQDKTLDHFYADAIEDAAELPDNDALIENALASAEREWRA